MARFEYKYVKWTDLQRLYKQARKAGKVPPKVPIERFIEQVWNEWGAEGWELVTVATTTLGGITVEGVYYWKRTL